MTTPENTFAALLADLTYAEGWEGAVEMRTEHGWVDVIDRVTALRDDLRRQVEALLAKTSRRRMAPLTYETGHIDGKRAALNDVLALLGGNDD